MTTSGPSQATFWPNATLETPQALGDAAMVRLARLHPDWCAAAHRAVLSLRGEFTADDVWRLVPPVDEPRALGVVMRRLRHEGAIVPTGRYVPSARRETHGRPVLVWRRT